MEGNIESNILHNKQYVIVPTKRELSDLIGEKGRVMLKSPHRRVDPYVVCIYKGPLMWMEGPPLLNFESKNLHQVEGLYKSNLNLSTVNRSFVHPSAIPVLLISFASLKVFN